jgi:hypothetical protein
MTFRETSRPLDKVLSWWGRAWASASRWAQASLRLRGARGEPSPEALVRAVRQAWPEYGDRRMTRMLVRTMRIARLPAPPRKGAGTGRGMQIG